MNLTKILGLAAVAALVLTAFASTASATTLETNGVKQSGAVTLEATQKGSMSLASTAGAFLNTCTASTMRGTTSVFTGAQVSAPLSNLSFSNCVPHGPPVVNSKGSLSVEHIAGTTNGTVRSTGASMTWPVTIFGSIAQVTCTTNNTDLGTLTGQASGTSVTHLTINTVLTCSGLVPTAKWSVTYVITGHAIGVVA